MTDAPNDEEGAQAVAPDDEAAWPDVERPEGGLAIGEPEPRRRRFSTASKVFVVVLALIVGGVFLGLNYVNSLLEGEPGPGEPIAIEVGQGATAGAIGEILEEEGVVRSALAFRLVARSRSLDSNLQAGIYDLETGMSVDEAIDALLAGPRQRESFRFTVEEGLAVVLTLERLAEQTPYEVADFQAVLDERLAAGEDQPGLLDLPDWFPAPNAFGPEVRQPFEGLLFPETYELFVDATPLDILQRMVDQLEQVMSEVSDEDLAAFEARELTRYDALIIGSLIERETRVNDEREVVSGVIRNRLDAGMLLQIDATVLYARGEHTERVLTTDTEIESPYNTYQVAGLPPTPIAGMGRASLLAAFRPADVTFRYYVVAPECDGTHRFADTLDEHNRNVEAFQAAGRCA